MVGGLGVVHDVSRGEERIVQHLRGHLQLLRLRVLVTKNKNRVGWIHNRDRRRLSWAGEGGSGRGGGGDEERDAWITTKLFRGGDVERKRGGMP